MKYKLGIQTKFDAAHSIPNHPKCGRIHGHTWTVEVVVSGSKLNDHDFLIDLHNLKEMVNQVLKPLDHRDLNLYFKKPTCENIASHIYNALHPLAKEEGVEVDEIKVKEGDGGWATVTSN